MVFRLQFKKQVLGLLVTLIFFFCGFYFSIISITEVTALVILSIIVTLLNSGYYKISDNKVIIVKFLMRIEIDIRDIMYIQKKIKLSNSNSWFSYKYFIVTNEIREKIVDSYVNDNNKNLIEVLNKKYRIRIKR